MTVAAMATGALDTDTIVAVASANGRAGVGVVRLSGPAAFTIGTAIAGALPEPRAVRFTRFRKPDGTSIDEGLVLCFQAPASFTGEDVIELQGHGSPIVLQLLVKAAVTAGARLARPGEFSERAYLNGKLDLTQAEAVADLINADSEAMAQGALRSLRGEFSELMHALVAALTQLRVQVEAAIDFPDEDIELLAEPHVRQALANLLEQVAHTRKRTREGVLLNEGVKLVLLGAPNVGKSSVLNRLCGADRAIVTEVAGTTRDLVRERIHLAGVPVELVDTAGLRVSQDRVEQEGIRRAEAAAVEADLVIAVFDASDPASQTFVLNRLQEIKPNGRSVNSPKGSFNKPFIVANKADLLSQPIVREKHAWLDDDISLVSAKDNTGVKELTERLVGYLGMAGQGEDQARATYSARTRHLVALEAAEAALHQAQQGIDGEIGAELVAEHLRHAQHELGLVCGELTSDALLGEIFSSFCIGK